MSYHILTGTMSCDNTVKPVFSGGPWNGPLTRYVKFRVAHAPGIPGTFSPPPRVSDPDMHHGTCVTHVPWCMLGSLTSGFLWSRWWASVPGIPSACATRNFTYLVRGPWKHRQYPNFCIFPYVTSGISHRQPQPPPCTTLTAGKCLPLGLSPPPPPPPPAQR